MNNLEQVKQDIMMFSLKNIQIFEIDTLKDQPNILEKLPNEWLELVKNANQWQAYLRTLWKPWFQIDANSAESVFQNVNNIYLVHFDDDDLAILYQISTQFWLGGLPENISGLFPSHFVKFSQAHSYFCLNGNKSSGIVCNDNSMQMVDGYWEFYFDGGGNSYVLSSSEHKSENFDDVVYIYDHEMQQLSESSNFQAFFIKFMSGSLLLK